MESTSAGTHALVGQPVYPPMASRLDAVGVAHNGAARQVDEPLLRQSDLILTMTRELRSRVVELVPAAVRRTFTLAEFAAIVAAAPRLAQPPSGRAELIPLVAAAAAQRSAVACGAPTSTSPTPIDGRTPTMRWHSSRSAAAWR